MPRGSISPIGESKGGEGSIPGWSKIMPKSILKVPIREVIKGRVCEWKAWGKVGLVPELQHPPFSGGCLSSLSASPRSPAASLGGQAGSHEIRTRITRLKWGNKRGERKYV